MSIGATIDIDLTPSAFATAYQAYLVSKQNVGGGSLLDQIVSRVAAEWGNFADDWALRMQARLSGRYVSLHEYGADETGASPADDALTAALAGGATDIFLRPGSYTFAAAHIIVGDGIRIHGADAEVTFTGDGVGWTFTGDRCSVDNLEIVCTGDSDGAIVMSGLRSSARDVSMTSDVASAVGLDLFDGLALQCIFDGFATGAVSDGASTFRLCFALNGDVGLANYAGTSMRVEHCMFEGNVTANVDADGCVAAYTVGNSHVDGTAYVNMPDETVQLPDLGAGNMLIQSASPRLEFRSPIATTVEPIAFLDPSGAGVAFEFDSATELHIVKKSNTVDTDWIYMVLPEQENLIGFPGLMALSTNSTFAADGTVQGDAILNANTIVFSSVANNNIATMRHIPGSGIHGQSFSMLVVNRSGSDVTLYPASGDQFVIGGHAQGVNVPITLHNNSYFHGRCIDSARWQIFLHLLAASSVTASTTQAQGNGLTTTAIVRATTVANENDTLTMAVLYHGMSQTFYNDGANTMRVYPRSGGTLRGLSADAPTTVAAGGTLRVQAVTSTLFMF